MTSIDIKNFHNMFYVGDTLVVVLRISHPYFGDLATVAAGWATIIRNCYVVQQNFELSRMHRSYDDAIFYRTNGQIVAKIILPLSDNDKIDAKPIEINRTLEESKLHLPMTDLSINCSTNGIFHEISEYKCDFRSTKCVITTAEALKSIKRNEKYILPPRLMAKIKNLRKNNNEFCVFNRDGSYFKTFQVEDRILAVGMSESELIFAVATKNKILFFDLDE